ncbi:ThuA domain-containing protein [Flavitalea sp.]|nr:ThuA domain-containing protein [Flavitalea sp.]
MRNKKLFAIGAGVLILIVGVIWFYPSKKSTPRVLLFSKTEGYRHSESIDAAQLLFTKMAQEHGFIADTTEDANNLNEDNLKKYQAIVFLHASGSILNASQRTSLQRYIQAGGGFLAIHASADAERDWPWFGKLLGGYFHSHPKIQQAVYRTIDKNHPASAFMPDSIERTDEYYNFEQLNPDIKVLMTLDENSYEGGNMGQNHPAVWYHEYDGGRSFYTSMGHTKETYSESFFIKQLWEGLNWTMGGKEPKALDYTNVIPEENRFVKTVLMKGLDEPMQLAIADDDRVFFAQRRGEIIEYDQQKKISRSVGTIPVFSQYEDGLLGLALDPGFSDNRWIYTYYTNLGGKAFNVCRFTLNDAGMIDLASRKLLLEIPKDILDGSHTGGALLFDPRGNGDLFITVGDNSSPRGWVYAPIDERPGREHWDAQRSSGNTNDLRGKILRIHPEANGTYSIPKGNLFAKGEPRTRPEIYSMGHRQPWRISMDTKTGWLYEGEVGPDSRKDSARIGPESYDEYNIIKKPGNYGWPYFVGPNKPYYKHDFVTGESGDAFDSAKPENASRNNTGISILPPAQPAVLYYPYAKSKEFPLMGTGARSAVGGPVFRKENFKDAKNTFPKYYEGKWFITEWLRGWILVVTIDENGNYKSMEQFMPSAKFDGPLDMTFGHDGSLYLLEYGKGWFKANEDAKLVRIEYNGGNRKPVVKVQAEKMAGSLPFKVVLSSKGSYDYDKDELKFEWKISNKDGSLAQTAKGTDASFTLTKAGVYDAVLTVTDEHGANNSASLELIGGNEPPKVKLDIVKGNSTFFFPGQTITYEVKVDDKEDGTLSNGKIPANKVRLNFDFASGGYSPVLGDPTPETEGLSVFAGMALNSSDCYSCHAISKNSIGPKFKDIADRYKGDKNALTPLANKVINGGSGSWGQVAMSAHPDLPVENAKRMVEFILALSAPALPSLPLSGEYKMEAKASNSKAVYVLKASYTDNSRNEATAVTTEDVIILRNPEVRLSEIPIRKGSMNVKLPSTGGEIEMLPKSGDYFAFSQIDLTELSAIEFSGSANGTLELRLDSPTGKIIGQVDSTQKQSKVESINKNNKSGKYRINISGLNGKHDLYFVLKGKAFMIQDKLMFFAQKNFGAVAKH